MTGSPRLDDCVRRRRRADDRRNRRGARAAAGAGDGEALVLVATKYGKRRAVLPRVRRRRARDAGRAARDQDPSRRNARTSTTDRGAGAPNVSVLPARAPLRAAAGRQPRRRHGEFDRGDRRGGAGRPGARHRAAEQPVAVRRCRRHGGRVNERRSAQALSRILYDEEFRQQLERASRHVLRRHCAPIGRRRPPPAARTPSSRSLARRARRRRHFRGGLNRCVC